MSETKERCGWTGCRESYVPGTVHEKEAHTVGVHCAQPPRRVTSIVPTEPARAEERCTYPGCVAPLDRAYHEKQWRDCEARSSQDIFCHPWQSQSPAAPQAIEPGCPVCGKSKNDWCVEYHIPYARAEWEKQDAKQREFLAQINAWNPAPQAGAPEMGPLAKELWRLIVMHALGSPDNDPNEPAEWTALMQKVQAAEQTIASLREQIAALVAERERERGALVAIAALKERPFDGFPADWHEQIEACSECQGWAKNHPIQRGICDEHRKPLRRRDKHDESEIRVLGYRAIRIATEALAAPKPLPAHGSREGDANG